MNQNDFDELGAAAAAVARALLITFEDLTGEPLDLKAAIRNYPVVVIGAAIGAGVLGGWWLGRRDRTQLPPPQPRRPIDSILDSIGTWRGGGANPASERDADPSNPLTYLERLIPDMASEQTVERARAWLDTVAEPKLREGMDTAAASLSTSRLGVFFRETLHSLELVRHDEDKIDNGHTVQSEEE